MPNAASNEDLWFRTVKPWKKNKLQGYLYIFRLWKLFEVNRVDLRQFLVKDDKIFIQEEKIAHRGSKAANTACNGDL